jgi:transposase
MSTGFIKLTLSVFLTVSILLAGSLAAPQTPEKSAIPSLIASLNLSKKQKEKLEPVYEAHHKQVQAVREDTTLSEEARRAKITASNQAINDQLRQTLTSDQKKKLMELRKGSK